MIEKVEGIVVGERSYSETSKILDVFTKKYGIIGVLSKGCKKMKSPLRSVSEKLTYGDFHIFYKENKLSTLSSVDVKDIFKNIKKDIKKISYAAYLLELSSSVYKQSEDEDVYDILKAALIKINENFDEEAITSIVELKYLNYLGILPNIDFCTICGNKKDIVTISLKGGYICKNCYDGEHIVSEKTIKLIRIFYYIDLYKIEKLEIGLLEKKQIEDFLDEYYERYTGLYLKSKSFLKNLKKYN